MKHLISLFLFCFIVSTNALGQKNKSLTFYGTPIEISSFSINIIPLTSLDNEQMAETAKSIIASDLQRIQRECMQLKTKLALNDWGYLELVDKVAHFFLPNDNEAVLLSYMLMDMSGYMVTMARHGNNLLLLFATNHVIYGCSYFTINNKTYYTYPVYNKLGKGQKATFFDISVKGTKPISLILEQTPNLSMNALPKREFKSKRYPEWSFSISCNENLINFYNDVPASMVDGDFMTKWSQLASTPLSENVQRQLYPKMSQLIQGLSQREAVERILNWIQTAFVFGYDEDYWGTDRAFFPEETLYYPYNDTEDRSALMSRIISDLLNLKTLFLYYPGHTAVGVAFTDEDVDGDYVFFEGQKYTVCDGVFIGASVGESIPMFKGTQPQKVIPVSPTNHLLANIKVSDNRNKKSKEEHTSPKNQLDHQPKQKSTATIDWIDFASTANKKEYQLKVGVKSNSKVEEVSVELNGSQSRGIQTVKSDGYDMMINRNLSLSEGYNSIVVSVRNEDGITTSKKMVTCTVAQPAPISNGKRIALVIGNANYQDIDKKLKNPVNDATDLAAKLKNLGFTVILSLDNTQQSMEAAILEFGKKAQNYDVALFYYAGHGIRCNGSNFLIPVDANLPEESYVQYKCTNANLVLDLLDKAKCQMKIVILDACRNNPFARSWNRSISGEGLSMMNAPRGTFIAYSTAPGDVALDGTGRNSPYTSALLQTLDIPNLSITDFFQEVLEKVAITTNDRQNPWTSGSFKGKFIFNQK